MKASAKKPTRMHIRKKDVVQVMVGKEKGKTGKVLRLIPAKARVVVEKLNIVKRHSKAQGTKPGGIVEKESSLAISNVLLYCDKCGKGVRSGVKASDKGPKRFCKKCKTEFK